MNQNFIMRPRQALLPKIILLAFILIVAGCSAIRLGYSNADTFVYWWMDKYVGFSTAQKPWVKDEIAKLLAWHRTNELPEYAQMLAQTQQRLDQPVSTADVHAEFDAVQQRVQQVVDRAVPPLSMLALSLSPQQISSIERRFAEKNEEYREEYLSGSLDKLQAERFKKVMKQAEYWFGDFSSTQKEDIRNVSDARPLNYELWMAERMRRQSEMIKMLRKIQAERPTPEATAKMLHAYATATLGNFTYAENKTFFDASRASMANLTAYIINIATPQQKVHATRRLQKLIDDGLALAAKDGGAQLSLWGR